MRKIVLIASVLALAATGPAHSRSRAAPGQADWIASKHYVQVNDTVKMAYVEWGNPSGEPVILIHGYSDSSRAYSTIAPYLEPSRRYIAIDLRGHGDSSEPACCYYASDLAEDVSDLIEVLGYEKADVIGHSLGSITAGVLASIHPDQVNRLVLISSTLKTGRGTDFLFDALHAERFPLDIDGEFMRMWAPDSSGNDQEMLAYLRKEEVAVPRHAWLGIAKGLEILDWTKASRHIDAPTLILWGDKDEMMTESDQVALRAALPQAKFIRYDGMGHSMYWEDPERVARDLNAFLN